MGVRDCGRARRVVVVSRVSRRVVVSQAPFVSRGDFPRGLLRGDGSAARGGARGRDQRPI